MCHWVEPSEGAQGEGKAILFYRNRNGLGVEPKVLEPTATAATYVVSYTAEPHSASASV